MKAAYLATLAGLFSLAMVLGALFFEYVVGVAPCEVCIWQRIPHAADAVIGLGGMLLMTFGGLDRKWGSVLVGLTILCLLIAGGLGVYHSGVEWKWWAGPSACTGDRYVITGAIDLNTPTVVRCDIVSWRLFGTASLANLNAVFSLGLAVLSAVLLRHPGLASKLVKRATGKDIAL